MIGPVDQAKGTLADAWAMLRTGSFSAAGPRILLYHRVADLSAPAIGPDAYTISPAALCDNLRRLSEQSSPVPLSRVAEWLQTSASLPSDAVAVTFDDGYRDVHETVLPLLKRFDVPATVFVSTRLVDERESPFALRLLDALRSREAVALQYKNVTVDRTLSSPDAVQKVYQDLYRVGKWATTEERADLLRCLKADREPVPMLRPGDVRTITRSDLMTVGSHGHAHLPYGPLSESQIRDHLNQSKDLLAQWGVPQPDCFAFPYGSTGPAARRAVEYLFSCSVTTVSRRVRPRDWGNAQSLPRIDGADQK